MQVEERERKPASHEAVLSWMAALCVGGGDLKSAEFYLLELLAWCAFALPEERQVLCS